MKKTVKRTLLVLTLVLALGAASALAAEGGFTIHKTDEAGKPLAGAGFEVYGKPQLAEEAPETEPETEPALTTVTVTKVWADADNKDGIRPEKDAFAASLHLMNGETEVKDAAPEITETDKNTWTVTWKDVPETDEAGEKIAYTVKEDAVEGYRTEGSPASDGGTITNTAVVDLVFEKIWNVGNYIWSSTAGRGYYRTPFDLVSGLVTTDEFKANMEICRAVEPADGAALTREDMEPLTDLSGLTVEKTSETKELISQDNDDPDVYAHMITYQVRLNGQPRYDENGNALAYRMFEKGLTPYRNYYTDEIECYEVMYSYHGDVGRIFGRNADDTDWVFSVKPDEAEHGAAPGGSITNYCFITHKVPVY